MDIDTVRLTPDTMAAAMCLYKELREDANFTHFQHTSPAQMLTAEWEVYMTLENDKPVAWGQIQKFDNPHKKHVVRLGFAVVPNRRNRGYGGQMLELIMAKCASYEKLVVTTFADNHVMLGMFLRRGFKIEGFFVNEEHWHGQSRDVISLAKYQEK